VETTTLGEISRLRQMSVADLQAEWLRLYGEPARSSNKTFLWKRLAWKVQARVHGGLSDQAKQKLAELAPHDLVSRHAPHDGARASNDPLVSPVQPHRDPRLPAPGAVLTRIYHDTEIRVLTLDDGFEWDGQHFRSLSAVAKAVTGQKWNGWLFFGLTQRKRKP
jgi:hypothetical protein